MVNEVGLDLMEDLEELYEVLGSFGEADEGISLRVGWNPVASSFEGEGSRAREVEYFDGGRFGLIKIL